MPLVIPLGLPESDPSTNTFNSREKAYNDDPAFKEKYDLKTLQLIYEYQQCEHLQLMNSLSQVPEKFHKLSFHIWSLNNTPINASREEAHEMLWYQRLIHLSPVTSRKAHLHCDGIPNLSKLRFDNITKCTTFLKANQTKSTQSTRSLMESVSHPYQGLFIDFRFSGRISKDKEGKVIESS